MKFRPCIDIHNGKVKQIVGGSLTDRQDYAKENYISEESAADFARRYQKDGLSGGHVILLNGADSAYYPETNRQALAALAAAPQTLQVGGGIHDGNAEEFLAAGASHVIVTSFVFQDGTLRWEHLQRLKEKIGREKLVLDLSCRKRGEDYYIVTNRWQRFTEEKVTPELISLLADSCDEFLIHAVDVEGKQNGVEQELLKMLGTVSGVRMTYAGGIHSEEDIRQIAELGRGRLDFTVGSALDLFGGALSYETLVARYGKPVSA